MPDGCSARQDRRGYGTVPHGLAGRFTWFIEGLCKAIGINAHKRRVDAVLVLEAWNRIRRLSERFLAVLARVQSGRLPRKITPHPNPPRRAPSRQRDGNPDQGGREMRLGAWAESARITPAARWLTRHPPRALPSGPIAPCAMGARSRREGFKASPAAVASDGRVVRAMAEGPWLR